MSRIPQSHLDRMERRDALRRQLREAIAESALLDAQMRRAEGTVDPYLRDRGITGEPSNGNRTFGLRSYGSRAGRGTWADVSIRDNYRPAEVLRQLPVVGTGICPFTGEPVYIDGNPTVNVQTPDGDVVILPVSHFRRTATGTRVRTGITETEAGAAQTYEERLERFGAVGDQNH